MKENLTPPAVTKTLNHAPGFQCPVCQKANIQLSLDQFLGSTQVTCPVCGTAFTMDKSQCARLVNMLQELHVAQRNAQLLSKQKL